MSLDVVGFSAGTVCADPEEMLRPYDIVFAKGRAALEALAVGAAVIVCDAAGLGPMVTAENVSRLRPLNFGIRLLRNELTVDAISAEIARYDPGDATDVSSLIRNTAGRDMVVDQLLVLYREVIEEHHRLRGQDVLTEQTAAAMYLRELKPRLQAAERLAATEAQLEMITNSRGWRLVSHYAEIKHRLMRTLRRKQK
jgi:hypothetical protein